MDERHQDNKDLLKGRLKEAKVYDSMGLYDEAREVYLRVLAEFQDLPEHSRARVQEEIDRLEDELNERDGEESGADLSSEELSFIKTRLLDGEDMEDAFTRATALVETGYYQEALDEFISLLDNSFPIDRFLGSLITTVLGVYGADQAVSRLETICTKASLGKRERAQIQFKLGMEMENLLRLEEAVSIYRSARATIPEDLNMRSALDAKIAALSTDSPYAYLLNQGWITDDDLQNARIQAGRTNASVEAVLMDQFNIAKADIGRSLSVYYGVPFKTYDPNVMAPVDLLMRLDRATLTLESWVPLAVYEREVDILMAAPNDASRIHRLKGLLNTDTINMAVGIREEIEAYLAQFYRVVEQAADATPPAEPEKPPHETRQARREPRRPPSIPRFTYVEFSMKGKDGRLKDFRLDVVNSSANGIGLLVMKEEADIIDTLAPGSSVKEMVFYAPWTIIHADARIRHLTVISKGPHRGHYLLGVESEEIVESSMDPE